MSAGADADEMARLRDLSGIQRLVLVLGASIVLAFAVWPLSYSIPAHYSPMLGRDLPERSVICGSGALAVFDEDEGCSSRARSRVGLGAVGGLAVAVLVFFVVPGLEHDSTRRRASAART